MAQINENKGKILMQIVIGIILGAISFELGRMVALTRFDMPHPISLLLGAVIGVVSGILGRKTILIGVSAFWGGLIVLFIAIPIYLVAGIIGGPKTWEDLPALEQIQWIVIGFTSTVLLGLLPTFVFLFVRKYVWDYFKGPPSV